MSKKSKHGRGKHPHIRKRTKMHEPQPMQSGIGTSQPAAGDTTPAVAPSGVAPNVSRQAPQALTPRKSQSSAALPLHYEFISGDLKMIGILTAIVIIILVVLFVFLK